MKITAEILKDYVFGELSKTERQAVETALQADVALREEVERLHVTQAALFSLREEELPRRIAFVSDKVFEPKWWQVWLQSSPRVGFASAALLAGAIVFHATWRSAPAALPPAGAPQVSAINAAMVERRISEEVARRLPEALAQLEQRHRTELVSAITQVEARHARQRAREREMVEDNLSYLQQKDATAYMIVKGYQ